MGDFQVTCINKPGAHSDPHSRIQYLGHEGRWKMTEREMIARIRKGSETFYTMVEGERAQIVIAERNGVPYLKTTMDDTRRDNLLSLPECRSCNIVG
jgi:hypothetical protein